MDRTEIAGLLFAISGLTALVQFALGLGFASGNRFAGLIGVSLLVVGATMYLSEGEAISDRDESSIVPTVAVAIILFFIGVGAYVVV